MTNETRQVVSEICDALEDMAAVALAESEEEVLLMAAAAIRKEFLPRQSPPIAPRHTLHLIRPDEGGTAA